MAGITNATGIIKLIHFFHLQINLLENLFVFCILNLIIQSIDALIKSIKFYSSTKHHSKESNVDIEKVKSLFVSYLLDNRIHKCIDDNTSTRLGRMDGLLSVSHQIKSYQSI